MSDEINDLNAVKAELSFRIALRVKHYVKLPYYNTTTTFPVCPKCQRCIDREYQPFCDQCGQKLKWDVYHRAELMPRR